MLSILGHRQSVCNGLSRRTMLQVGGAGLFGLSAAKLRAAEVATGQFQNGRAKSVIFVFLFGGPSQLETLDMKPDAPSNLRGPFTPIDARTPGLRICQHMPRLAQMSDTDREAAKVWLPVAAVSMKWAVIGTLVFAAFLIVSAILGRIFG